MVFKTDWEVAVHSVMWEALGVVVNTVRPGGAEPAAQRVPVCMR